MVYNKIKFSVKHSKIDERFCYNAHQHGNSFHQYSDHLITVPMYKVIYFTTNKEHERAV